MRTDKDYVVDLTLFFRNIDKIKNFWKGGSGSIHGTYYLINEALKNTHTTDGLCREVCDKEPFDHQPYCISEDELPLLVYR